MGYKRSVERKRRLKKLCKKTEHGYGAGAYWDEDKKRYIRYSCHNKWLRTHSRRVIRRKSKRNAEQYSGKGNHTNKLYDYWWILL